MQDVILNTLKESIAVKDASIKANRGLLEKGAGRLAECLVSGHKVLIFGNGGSAADAQHIAAEMVNRFHR
jgi:D-sedoheptulose 7-phosphate isomerase